MKKKCPCGNGDMEIRHKESKALYNGVEVNVFAEKYICPCCGIEAGTIKQAAKLQHMIAESYREKTGLLTGSDIKRLRLKSGLTEAQLAMLMDTNETTISDWESCIVQSLRDDKILRKILSGEN